MEMIWIRMLPLSPAFNLIFALTTAAAPNQPGELVGFKPQDGDRDTLSLIISCLLTLSLCVYSAVHLNIPYKREPEWRTRLREAKWCILGLFGPELILYVAWRQWNSARALSESIEKSIHSGKALCEVR